MSDRITSPYTEYYRSRQQNSPGGSVPRTPGYGTPRGGTFIPETHSGQYEEGFNVSPGGGTSAAPSSNHQPIERLSVDDILRAPGHDALPRLHPKRPPGTTWFKIDSSVAKVVREVWIGDYKEFAPNISATSADTVERWFEGFAQRYHWDSVHTGEVRKMFRETLTERMTDQTYRWKQVWNAKGDVEGHPPGLRSDIWEKLIKFWKEDASIVKSEKTKKSRRNPDGTVSATHRSGKTSFPARALKICEKTGEAVPDLVELLVETKRKKDGTFCNKTSEQLFNDVTSKMEELRGSQSDPESMGSVQLTAAEKNQIYKEVAPRKKGKIYGVGSLHSRIEGTSSGSFSSRSEDELKELVESQNAQIATQQEKLEQLEIQLQTETQAKSAENAAIKNILAHLGATSTDPVLQTLIQSLTAGSSSSSAPQSDPTNPPNE